MTHLKYDDFINLQIYEFLIVHIKLIQFLLFYNTILDLNERIERSAEGSGANISTTTTEGSTDDSEERSGNITDITTTTTTNTITATTTREGSSDGSAEGSAQGSTMVTTTNFTGKWQTYILKTFLEWHSAAACQVIDFNFYKFTNAESNKLISY